MSEVKIIIRSSKQKDGSPHISVDCVPNLEEIPDGEVKALVRSMLDASGVTSWKQTLDVRKTEAKPALRLVQ